MKLFTVRSLTVKTITAGLLVFGSTMAYADGARFNVPNNAKWKEECGSCHIAYPPQLLTGNNWQKMMTSLDKHFGANATLDAADNKEILNILQGHAGSGDKHSANSLRITDTSWFKREHREIADSAWSSPAIKSRANCTACHVNAERGDWSEDGVRMPGGKRYEKD